MPLEPLAGDFTGGRFYLCGDGAEPEPPVLYASSEGQAGLIANGLREVLELVVGLPYWHECLTHSGDGRLEVMSDTARHMQNDYDRRRPELPSLKAETVEILSLDSPSPAVLVERLHAAVLRTEPEFVFRDDTAEYEGLFGCGQPGPHLARFSRPAPAAPL